MMAHLLNTDSIKFSNQNIQKFQENKVGQFSRFLNSPPLFATYFSINNALSTAGIGSLSIKSEIGDDSPVRFNRIDKLPIFNISDLKPETQYDESSGLDLNLEINNAIVLPSTVKPKSGDYVYFKFPNNELLFRIHDFNYNSIQSNDFYTFNADIKLIGNKNIINTIQKQVVEEYECVYEKIGTQDKCFLLKKDLRKLETLDKLIIEIRNLYSSMFYDKRRNLFVYKFYEDGLEKMFYDIYLIRFIKESRIFENELSNTCLSLTYDDILPTDFEILWRKTFWHAVLLKTFSLINLDIYYNTNHSVQKYLSPLKIERIPNKSVQLQIIANNEFPIGNNNLENNNLPIREYFSKEFLLNIIHNKDSNNLSLTEKLIKQYMIDDNIIIENFEPILDELLIYNQRNFYYMPIIIYILINIHKSYFNKEE